MTISMEQFIRNVNAAQKQCSDLRYGQTCFNTLKFHEPMLAEEIRGTMLDPFYRDDRIPEFFNWLATRLPE